MPEWKDVLAALIALIASFAGAWAAFRFESCRRKREEDEKRIGAANRAIYVVYHYWNILEQFRKEALETHRDKADAWLNLAAHPSVPEPTDSFLPNDLQFLLQVEKADTYVTLMLEEQRFLMALGLIRTRSELVLNEVFPRMSAAGIRLGQPMLPQHIEAALGVDITHKLKEITAAIYKNIDEDLVSLRVAHDKLRTTMKTLYPHKKFIQVVFNEADAV